MGADDHKVGSVDHIHGRTTLSMPWPSIGGKPAAASQADPDWMRTKMHIVHAVTSWTKIRLAYMPDTGD